jgi:hypothetical protein
MSSRRPTDIGPKIHAREVGVKHVVIAGAVEVHRHGQWNSGGSG